MSQGDNQKMVVQYKRKKKTKNVKFIQNSTFLGLKIKAHAAASASRPEIRKWDQTCPQMCPFNTKKNGNMEKKITFSTRAVICFFNSITVSHSQMPRLIFGCLAVSTLTWIPSQFCVAVGN